MKKDPKWQQIGYEAWELAKQAYKNYIQTKKDPYEYIWEKVEEYPYNSYERGVFGQWACDDTEIIIETEKRKEKEK